MGMKRDSLSHIIKEGIHDLFHIWLEELRNVFKDQGVLIFFILVPLGYPVLYTFIYTNEGVRDVPVAVVDNAHSALSRKFLRLTDGGANVEIVSRCADMEEAKELVRQRKAYGIIYIPEEFDRDLAQGRQTRVMVYCDMSGLLYYKAILSTCTDVSLKMNKEIKVARMGNTTDRQDEVGAQPIKYAEVSMFNPQGGFACFIIPGVIILIIQQTLLLGIGLSVGTAREHNRFADLVPINRHYHGTLRIVLGKSLVYFMVFLLMGTYMTCLIPHLFSLLQLAHAATLFGFLIPYIAACIFFAMTASILIRDRETCMVAFIFTSMVFLFISGISWPGAAVPAFWKYVSYLFPSTFGINGFIRINSMGATLDQVRTEYQALWLQAGCYFITACLVYRHQIMLSRKHALQRLQQLRDERAK